jgi:tetratricopeptide (TPR) repeat protein
MWFENTASTLKTKELLLSLRILFVPALIMCLNLCQGLSYAAVEVNQLDPTLILLHQPQIENVQQAEKFTGQDNTITSPNIEPKVCEPPKIPTQNFLHNVKSLFFSAANLRASPEQQQEPQRQQADDQQQVTPKNKLLKTSISSITTSSDSANKQLLSGLVKQISSMKLRPRPKEPEPESQPQDESKESISDTKEAAEPTGTKPVQVRENRQQQLIQTLNPEIVQRLELIIEQSGTTNEPQLLADMLYQTGYYELAAYFYELAISRDAKADVDDADKAWLMMQKAVCLSDSDPQQALQIYKNLVSQYPASLWVELAKSQETLINWLETQQPENLIEQCRKDLQTN